jgi:NTP pyrophosphatase (non-canonical NTP hydrolase)
MLNKLAKSIYNDNAAKGFWPTNPKERNVGEALMLMTSELGEGMEAHRKGKFVNPKAMSNCMEMLQQNGHGMDEQQIAVFQTDFKKGVKDTFEDELADAMIRILDFCGGFDIDIQGHIEAKLAYNRTRPKLHGKKY